MSKKEILLDDTLLQLKNLEESISKNTKGILASVMKEEIKSLVKESLGGDTEEVKEQVEDDELEMDLGDEGSEEEIEFDMEDEGDEEEMDVDFPAGFGDEEEDFEAMGDEELDFDMEDELEGEDEDLVDITNMSDEELVKVFKLMGDEDGVVVQKEDDEIHLKDENEGVEYEIQLEGEDHDLEEMMDMKEMDTEVEEEVSEMEEVDEEEVMYEIEFNEEEEEEEEVELEETYEEAHEGEEYKEEAKEAARTLGNGKYWGRDGLPKPHAAPSRLKAESYKRQIAELKEKNEEYKKALDLFRTKLNEVAIFNSNLAYATRLFTEHSTTKKEKINILKRFDNVETLKESKNLYKSIKNELVSSATVVTESVVNKVQKTPQKGSTNLVESKTYENAQFLRMKDLMTKINK